MCESVPNGLDKCENAHVSILISFMKGENDSKLKWPFCGEVTVLIQNWLENDNHITKTVPFKSDA